MTEPAGKVRENLARRMAQRQGMTLEKSRRRDPRALGYGRYRLAGPAGIVCGDGFTATLDEIEQRLRAAGQEPEPGDPYAGENRSSNLWDILA